MRRSSLPWKVGPVMCLLLMCLCAGAFAGAYITRSFKKTKTTVIIIVKDKSSSCAMCRPVNFVYCILSKLLVFPFRVLIHIITVVRVTILHGLNECRFVLRSVFVIVWRAVKVVVSVPVKLVALIIHKVVQLLSLLPAEMRVLIEKVARALLERVKNALLEIRDAAVGKFKDLLGRFCEAVKRQHSVFQALLRGLRKLLADLNSVFQALLRDLCKLHFLPARVMVLMERAKTILQDSGTFSLEAWDAAFDKLKMLSPCFRGFINRVSQLLFHDPSHELQRFVYCVIDRALENASHAATTLVSFVSDATHAAAASFRDVVASAGSFFQLCTRKVMRSTAADTRSKTARELLDYAKSLLERAIDLMDE